MRTRSLLGLLSIPSLAFAGSVLEAPGCYALRGFVKSAKENTLVLVTHSGSRSEEAITITLDKPLAAKAGALFGGIVFTPKAGPAPSLAFTAHAKELRILPAGEDPEPAWNWVAKSGEKGCAP